MIVVATMAAVLWGTGMAMRTPVQARLTMLGLLITGVLAIHVVLPDGHPLREGTGGEPEFWLLILAFAAAAFAYSRGLRWLRARQRYPDAASAPEAANDVELDRNSRHILLREIGGPGQRRLKNAKVLVVGAGGLGSAALQTLAAAGVGTIGVIDDDVVENSNLARQVIHRDVDIGLPKVFSAERAMRTQNPFVEVRPYHRRLTSEIASDLFEDYDLILDGCDDFQTRQVVSATAVALKLPLVSGALSQWEGQLSVFDPARGTPCYACIFDKAPDPARVPPCAEAGVFSPLPGVIGTMMAAEAVKLLSGAGRPLLGRMLIYNALDAEAREIMLKRHPGCSICG